jgi:hypothetical protein
MNYLNPIFPNIHFYRTFSFLLLLAIALDGSKPIHGQSALSGTGTEDDADFFVRLDAFVKYGGDMDVIDGLTGRPYHSDNKVVKAIHSNFPKILGGLHQKLLILETLHMNFHLEQGALHEQELAALAESFGITNFKLDKTKWLIREKAILARLRAKPFFQVKELVIWEKEEMDPILPSNKYAKNLRYDRETQSWERRVLTEWKVNVPTRKGLTVVVKNQGLNLETNNGFHIIRDRGLPVNVHPSFFREVRVSYPIIVSRKQNTDEQINYLQRLIVKNMSHLYDPFTWIGRRNTRFRKVFSSTLLSHFRNRSYKVHDRDWFDPVLCNFLNDVVTVNQYGLKEVYDLYIAGVENPKNTLGEGFDPLNWNAGEKRKGAGMNKGKPIRLRFENSTGARFVLFDMYLRYGDDFLDNFRSKLTSLKRKGDPREIISASIAEVSGRTADTYINAALKAQEAGIADYRKSR